MRWILLFSLALLSGACPPKDVPDPPAVGASAPDGQKLRQPAPPRVPLPAAPEPAAEATRASDPPADADTGAPADTVAPADAGLVAD